MEILLLWGIIILLAFILPYSVRKRYEVSMTIINPNWDLEEKYEILKTKYELQNNMIAEYDDENRKLKKTTKTK